MMVFSASCLPVRCNSCGNYVVTDNYVSSVVKTTLQDDVTVYVDNEQSAQKIDTVCSLI